ncbi:hypothetical protein MA16_Dca005082 [Dendrobium catenatum]|uniref:Uncharacterized protein n=1 Tax=Dendrobium catenatum TaxID=906689 RepID=A0A2I0WGW3_9ASPA|nr:hypothetical protein MA16_Dca005082 [Dendrobium catenatum]
MLTEITQTRNRSSHRGKQGGHTEPRDHGLGKEPRHGKTSSRAESNGTSLLANSASDELVVVDSLEESPCKDYLDLMLWAPKIQPWPPRRDVSFYSVREF